MRRKIPPEAFAFYLALGPGRGYQAVATQFKVSKKAIQLCADREHWRARLAEEEEKARKAAEKQAINDLKAAREQHLKVIRYVQGKAIQKFKSGEFETVMDAVKAYALMREQERDLLGEPTEQTAMDIEKKIREEHETWLVPVDQDETADGQPSGEQQTVPSEPPPVQPGPTVESAVPDEEPSAAAEPPSV